MQQPAQLLKWSFGRYRPVIRSFFSQIGKSHLVFPAALLTATAIGSANLGLIFFVRLTYGFSPSTVGLFAASYSVWYFIGCVFLRPIGQRLRPRFSLIIATGSMGTVMLLLVLIGHPVVAFVLYSLFGLLASLFWPPIMGWLSSGLEGKELSRTISRFNLSWSTGTIMSPYIAGALAEIANRLAIYFGIALLFSATLLVVVAALYWARIKSDDYLEPRVQKIRGAKGAGTPLRYPAWVGIVATYVTIGVIANIFPMFARDHTALSKGQIGLVLLARALVSTIAFVGIGRTSFWQMRKPIIIGGQLALAGSIGVMIFMQGFAGFLLSVMIFGIIFSFNYSSSIFHGVSGSTERAKRMSVHESISTLGVVVGSVVGGVLYQSFSMTVVYLFCIVVALVGAIIQGTMFVRLRAAKNKVTTS
ncbi:MAG TPA: MFS transporter [Spirochaetia bacterium]|nr:MFS transporter [Spirochaetia bacterium]